MSNEAFVGKCIAEFPSSIADGSIAFDIGANHGSHTKEMSKKFRQVYAFEPEDANFDILMKNMTEYENVVLVQEAISNITGHTLLTPSSNPGGHSISPLVRKERKWGHDASKSYEVPCVTIDDFCEHIDEKPALIKMDIEGAETFVWEGARKMLATHKLSIILEVHQTVDLAGLWSFFVPYGFHIIKDDGTVAKEFQYDVHYYLTNLFGP